MVGMGMSVTTVKEYSLGIFPVMCVPFLLNRYFKEMSTLNLSLKIM